jgi:hypothetical protein
MLVDQRVFLAGGSSIFFITAAVTCSPRAWEQRPVIHSLRRPSFRENFGFSLERARQRAGLKFTGEKKPETPMIVERLELKCLKCFRPRSEL